MCYVVKGKHTLTFGMSGKNLGGNIQNSYNKAQLQLR